jgi:hypothetical protein
MLLHIQTVMGYPVNVRMWIDIRAYNCMGKHGHRTATAMSTLHTDVHIYRVEMLGVYESLGSDDERSSGLLIGCHVLD